VLEQQRVSTIKIRTGHQSLYTIYLLCSEPGLRGERNAKFEQLGKRFGKVREKEVLVLGVHFNVLLELWILNQDEV